MRILAICYEDPQLILGGMGMHVRKLYQAMARRGDVEIDLLTNGEHDGPIEYDGYLKHSADKLVCWKPRRPDFACLGLLDIQMMRTLMKLLAAGKTWDVVHAHEWNSLQVSRAARDACKIPMVGTMHLCLTKLMQVECTGVIDYAGLSEADLFMMNQEGSLICGSDELILCSKAYVRIAREMFLTDRNIHLIYNGIDLEEWCPVIGDRLRGRMKNLLSDRPIALFVGRVATMKGIQYVLDVVEGGDIGWQIVVAGEVNANSETDKEQWYITRRLREVEQIHPERLRWLGFRHGQALKDLYAAADVVLMPSVHEPFGIVALEAMAMGVPLISTEVDGLGEIVSPPGGEEFAMIIPPRSPRAIVAALHDLQDEAKRMQLRDLGLRRAKDYSWDVAAEKTVEVYRTAMSRAGGHL